MWLTQSDLSMKYSQYNYKNIKIHKQQQKEIQDAVIK